jgi:transcriptional antiterminator NusG
MDGYWYVIHIYSGHEKKVKMNLEQRVSALALYDEILQVIVPMKEVASVKDGKRRVQERPSYPGYIIIQACHELGPEVEDEDSRRSWYIIRETPGVMGFVGASGSNPTPLNEDEVKNILNLSSDEEKEEPVPTIDFGVGDQVKVIDGPFNGFGGEIKAIDLERQRLHLVISIFGRATPVELGFLEVEQN